MVTILEYLLLRQVHVLSALATRKLMTLAAIPVPSSHGIKVDKASQERSSVHDLMRHDAHKRVNGRIRQVRHG